MDILRPYPIALNRIKSSGDLVVWITHLCSKGWMNPHRIRVFIEKVCAVKCWDPHRSV